MARRTRTLLPVAAACALFAVAAASPALARETALAGGGAAQSQAGRTSNAPALRSLTINGGPYQNPAFNSSFSLTGTAPVGETVSLHFHKAGTDAADYSVVRSVTADATGFWIRPVTANTDYRYYATDGELTSPSVLNQPDPSINGDLQRTVRQNSANTLDGGASPHSTVYLHVHPAGTAAGDYSKLLTVDADGAGYWFLNYQTSADFRIYASHENPAAPDFISYLVQAR